MNQASPVFSSDGKPLCMTIPCQSTKIRAFFSKRGKDWTIWTSFPLVRCQDAVETPMFLGKHMRFQLVAGVMKTSTHNLLMFWPQFAPIRPKSLQMFDAFSLETRPLGSNVQTPPVSSLLAVAGEPVCPPLFAASASGVSNGAGCLGSNT